jgi:hypothetical protein
MEMEDQLMPLHDWTRVPSGLFHHFHQSWTIRISDALNAGRLPRGIDALVEQRTSNFEADVLSVETRGHGSTEERGGSAVAELPRTAFVRRTTREIYAGRANRIVIRHHLGRILAIIEIISPGNKDSRAALRDFIEKTLQYMRAGIHLLIVDLFPPSPRDPFGIHKLIWDEIEEEDFHLPQGKDRVLVSYEMAPERAAFIEPVGVGDSLPDMPLFLTAGWHVPVPLEPTYMATWDAAPAGLRTAVETGVLPTAEEEP